MFLVTSFLFMNIVTGIVIDSVKGFGRTDIVPKKEFDFELFFLELKKSNEYMQKIENRIEKMDERVENLSQIVEKLKGIEK